MPIQTQREVGDYVVLRELTLGGETFLVEHKYMKRLYLLKLLPEELGTDTSTMQRIQTDFGLLSTVEHPAIVKLHTISYDQGRYFLIMDAVLDESGQMTTLRSHLQSGRGRFSEGDLHNLLFQVGSALDALHSVQREGKPMLHLGLKLDNILVGKGKERPKVALIDYGLASLVGDNNILKRAFGCVDEQQEGDAGRIQFLQNFAFLSPEQRMIADVRKLTPASDTYAFGVLAYYLIGQRFPEGYFPMPSKLVEHYRWDWDGLIALCLQTDANERPLLLSSLLEKLATGGRLYDLSTRAGRYSPVQAPRDFQDDEGDGHEVSLKPVIHDGSVDRPSKDYDISNNLKVDSTVKVYQPEELDIKDVQPLRSEMVIVQGGAFNRGSHEGNRDASPRHQVRLNSFAIDIHPVTNEQFVRFLMIMNGEKDRYHRDMIRLKESRINRVGGKFTVESGYHKHPVVGVTWYGASAYAKWVGKRLPTEAEWEVAASGAGAEELYPTGKEIDKTKANYFSVDTTAVMSYPPNVLGIYDLAGNVYEWCYDWYDYNYYYSSAQEPDNPKGPFQGVYRVLRGGCWKSSMEDLLCSRRHRNNPGTVNATYGFRCAADAQ